MTETDLQPSTGERHANTQDRGNGHECPSSGSVGGKAAELSGPEEERRPAPPVLSVTLGEGEVGGTGTQGRPHRRTLPSALSKQLPDRGRQKT